MGDTTGNATTPTNGILDRPAFKVRMADISDGTSNTLAISEKRLKIARMNTYTSNPEYDDNEPFYCPGFDSEMYRRAVTDSRGPSGSYGPSFDLPDALASEADPLNGFETFGSSHPAGVNAGMADGSVRSIRYDPTGTAGGQNVFRRVCVKNDGVPFSPDDL